VTVEIPVLVAIAADAAAAPAPVVVEVRSSPGSAMSGWRAAGIATAGVGAAALVFGAVSGVLAIHALDDAKELCPGYPGRCDSAGAGSAANDRARTFARLSDAGFVGGGVLAAAGAIMFLVATKEKSGAAWGVAPDFGRGAGTVVGFARW
jgi:hypothetical protein